MTEGGGATKPIPSTKTVARHDDDDDDDDIAAVSVVVAAALKTTINRQWLKTRRVMEGRVMAVRGVGKDGEGAGRDEAINNDDDILIVFSPSASPKEQSTNN